jgi:hypothetical protein
LAENSRIAHLEFFPASTPGLEVSHPVRDGVGARDQPRHCGCCIARMAAALSSGGDPAAVGAPAAAAALGAGGVGAPAVAPLQLRWAPLQHLQPAPLPWRPCSCARCQAFRIVVLTRECIAGAVGDVGSAHFVCTARRHQAKTILWVPRIPNRSERRASC